MLILSLLIGITAGLRSAAAPAVVAWAAHLKWIHLDGSSLSWMGSTAAVAVFTLLALGELVVDKLPSTPSRTTVGAFLPRIVLGALSGAALGIAGSRSGLLGAALGLVGAIVGTFGGYQSRVRLVRALKVPDFVVACVEDIIAIGGALLIVTRF